MEAPLLSDEGQGEEGGQKPQRASTNSIFIKRIAASLLLVVGCLAWSDEVTLIDSTKELVETHISDSLAERVHKVASFHRTDMDDTTLGKPGQLAMSTKAHLSPHPGTTGMQSRFIPSVRANRQSSRIVKAAAAGPLVVGLRGRSPSTQSAVATQAATTEAAADIVRPPFVAENSTEYRFNKMEEEALAIDPESFKPTRGSDGRLQPVLMLPGDTLETTPKMRLVFAAGTLTMVGIVTRAFVVSDNPLWPLFSVALGGLAAELFSGTFHWATDNYGSIKTPVVGSACAAFQGHHLAPWTISHRSFENNVSPVMTATIPFNLAAGLILPPSGAAFFAVMLYCQVLAQEFHRWTHTPPKLLPAWKKQLQEAGIALPLNEHLNHHRPPFDKHYCILNGRLNGVLDSEPVLFFRRLEAFVYHLTGQEPLSWKEPRVKKLALSTWPGDKKVALSTLKIPATPGSPPERPKSDKQI